MILNIKRYCLTLAGCIIGFTLLDFALELAGISLPVGMSVYLPPLIAAMFEGQRHARQDAAPLAKGEAWRVAGAMTLWAVIVQIAFALISVAILTGMGGRTALAPLSQLAPFVWAIIAFVLIGLTYLFNRLGLGLGLKSERKAQTRAK